MNRIARPAFQVRTACASVTTCQRLFCSSAVEDTVVLVSKGQQGDSDQRPLVQCEASIPAEFCQSYHIKGLGERSGTSLKTVTGHEIRTDLPLKMGGQDVHPQPVELLLAALIGCTQATAVFVGRNMKPRLVIDHLEFDIRASRDERGALALPILATPTIPAGIHTVEGTIKVYIKKGLMSANQLETLAEQTEARCPVASMMTASGCNMGIEWMNGDADSSK